MNPESDPARLLDDLLEQVASVLTAGSTGEPAEGTDPDEVVRVRLGADGRVAEIQADPRVLRDPTTLAPAIVSAVNAAVAARPATSGRNRTVAQLQKLQQESLTVTRKYNASLVASLEALKGEAR